MTDFTHYTVVVQVIKVVGKHTTYKDTYDKVGTEIPREVSDIIHISLTESTKDAAIRAAVNVLDVV